MEILVANLQQCAVFEVGHDDRPVVGKVIENDGGKVTLHHVVYLLACQSASDARLLGVTVNIEVQVL